MSQTVLEVSHPAYAFVGGNVICTFKPFKNPSDCHAVGGFGFTFPDRHSSSPPDMDKFWSIMTMPIGVAVCFGPAVFVWWLTRGKEQTNEHERGKKRG